MFGIYDYMLEEYYDPDRFDGVRDYFYRRHAAYSDYTLDEDIASERLKKDNEKATGKKAQQRNLCEQDTYDAVEEQVRHEARELERHIHRCSVLGGYIPCGYERDF